MKIAVLVSGGVDSSVVLARLHEQGHDVTAFYLKIWLEDELTFLGNCPWEEDLSYVRALCEQLSIPLQIVPLQEAYRDRIVKYTIDEVRAGRTPSPDVLCNVRIKFGAFLEAIGDSYEKVASGHYGQVRLGDSGLYELFQSPDAIKDQTYFLSHLRQSQLSRLLLPIGHMTKEEVRAEAQRYQVPSRDRKDSQGICFLGKISFNDFIEHYLGKQPGDIFEEETGDLLGHHNGFWFHTIGQRRGMRLSGGPWYVVRKDPVNNALYVSRQYHAPEKKRNEFVMRDVHFIGKQPEKEVLSMKMRHGPEMVSATLAARGDGKYVVQLAKRDQGLAPGQFAVMYDGDVCLGCGVIDE
ncbi:MAG: tRNA-5-taurinomethyluridine 2-sulfurtransferase [Candidatus Dependentiae bacterium]|nr:tRNA-5-taurinomethyluridine 2-sulfurtransferase [Candidatus Dependentiae bacterium]